MSESIFIFCIYPLLICIFSIAVTYKVGTFYVMPMVTFLIFLMLSVTLYDLSFFFWVGMYTIFSFIISYIAILFVRGYKAVDRER
ncbi:YbeF family protein [Bacillus cereus]|uniref:YbeF family protein n=1 Tax=Bacillus cereus TaxID=1396 RepID=UPI001879BA51|nr:YbeF family protein [Bacillus cereus]MBE7097228.1 DUF2651 domain-containing protein [Bacillus cereus]HDR7913886.1 YbeF family protein [Bacillus wiedmannii]